MKIAACYIRVSTEDQLEYSPDAQLREIRRYAEAHDMVLDQQHIYMDEGISGRNTKKRAGFNQMIGVAKSKPKPFDVILLWKFSRFARNREDAIVYKSMLRKIGIEVISITESVGDDKMSVLIEAMIEAMDEYYSINLGEEVVRGMTQKALTGGTQSAPPFGYLKPKDATCFVPHPEEAPIVRRIFSDYLNGRSFFAIARSLNDAGITTKRGNRFEQRQIEYMIQNPVYKGFLRWTPYKAVSKRIYDCPDTISVPGPHEPIVDADIWEQAQEKCQKEKAMRKPHARAAESKRHYLSGILKCGNCGSALNYSTANQGFQCHGYARGTCERSCFISGNRVEQLILATLEKKEQQNAYVYINPPIARPPVNEDLDKQITRVTAILEKARQAYLAGADSLEEYAATKASLTAKIAELEQQRKPEQQAETKIAVRIRDIRHIITSNIPPAEKNSALAAFFDHITFRRTPEEEINFFLR